MARPHQRDLFGECNVQAHPIDQFVRECCANCVNPECTRSLAGKAKFDQRTRTWFEQYFGAKDLMDPSDPRYTKIAGQGFMFMDPGLVGIPHSVGEWIDPRDVQQPKTGLVQMPSAPLTPTAVPREPVAPVGATPPSPPSTLSASRRQLLLANTPAPQQGIMVSRPPNANTMPTTVTAAPTDPWAAPTPGQSDDAPVVGSGARVKFGGGV